MHVEVEGYVHHLHQMDIPALAIPDWNQWRVRRSTLKQHASMRTIITTPTVVGQVTSTSGYGNDEHPSVTRESAFVAWWRQYAPDRTDIDTIYQESLQHRLQNRVVEVQGKIQSLAGTDNLDQETVKVAIEFAACIPYTDEVPEISATPRGEIYFEWVEKGILAVSVCPPPDHKIVFAGRFGNDSFSGSGPWSGTLPRVLKCELKFLA